MIVCWDRCSRPTILRPHSSFAGLFARSIARSISTSTTHESDLPHETCLNPQDCRTQGALGRIDELVQATDDHRRMVGLLADVVGPRWRVLDPAHWTQTRAVVEAFENSTIPWNLPDAVDAQHAAALAR